MTFFFVYGRGYKLFKTDRKTEKIKISVKSTEKYLGVKGLSCEIVEKMLD